VQVEVAVLGRTGVPPGLAARPLVAGELALAAPLRLPQRDAPSSAAASNFRLVGDTPRWVLGSCSVVIDAVRV